MKQAAVYEWVVESLTKLIRSIALNHLEKKQAAVYEWGRSITDATDSIQ